MGRGKGEDILERLSEVVNLGESERSTGTDERLSGTERIVSTGSGNRGGGVGSAHGRGEWTVIAENQRGERFEDQRYLNSSGKPSPECDEVMERCADTDDVTPGGR